MPNNKGKELITDPYAAADQFCSKDKYLTKRCTAMIANKKFSETTTANGDIYWIQNFDLPIFVNETLPTIRHYFSIYFSSDLDIHSPLFWDTDTRFNGQPSLIDKIIQNKYLLHYFATNYDGTMSEKFIHPMPLGLDIHSGNANDGIIKQHAAIKEVTENKVTPVEDKKFKIYLDYNLRVSYPEYLGKWDALFGRDWRSNTNYTTKRSNHSHEILKLYLVQKWQRKYYFRNWIVWNIQKNDAVNETLFHFDRVFHQKYDGFAKRSEFMFSFSPFGTGLDCHRTYEALLMSNIVIVISSPLDALYKEHDLPVVAVDSMDEINSTMLEFWYEAYKDKVYANNAETRFKLTNEYWMKYIKTATMNKLNDILL